MTIALECLARDELGAQEARTAIDEALRDEKDLGRIYASLCRWSWRIVLEHRLDDELATWHRLLLDTSAKVRSLGAPKTRGRLLGGQQISERLKALADMVRLTVEAADASSFKDLIGKAHVREILAFLSANRTSFVDRKTIKQETKLQDANLTRVLTLLLANGLIEREPRGREASFRITSTGVQYVERAPQRTVPPGPRMVEIKVRPFPERASVKTAIEGLDSYLPQGFARRKPVSAGGNEEDVFAPDYIAVQSGGLIQIEHSHYGKRGQTA